MSPTVPTGARSEWPYEPEERGQAYTGERNMPGAGRGDRRAPGSERGGQDQGRGAQGGRGYPPAGYGNQGYAGQGPRPDARGQGAPGGQRYPGDGYGQPRGGYNGRPRGGQAYPERGGFDRPGYPPQAQAGRGGQSPAAPTAPVGNGYGGYGGPGYAGQGYAGQGYGDEGYADQFYGAQGYGDPAGRTRGYPDETEIDGFAGRGGPGGRGPGRKVRFRRIRRWSHLRSVRIASAIVAVFVVWVMFSAGQAAFKSNGQGFSANLAEWARDHYLGPVVTFGEWLSYNPPKAGGKPSFSLAVPKSQQLNQSKSHPKGFVPDIPAALKPLASGPALPGEGQWRVLEKVNGQPAILKTLLRDGGQYTSYVNGIASIDQRLVTFSLRPGTEDPGAGNWGVPNYIPSGSRNGLLATFNGGFKLDSAMGGFYLNGIYHGSLVNGAASIVYYKNGTIKIGQWGRDFTMNSSIEGVRQNLKLLVDHGKVASDANSAVLTNWGATLGGGEWVWRSGLGITKDGRVLYVYGPALNAEDLAQLLQRAGAVEGMQMDINPSWMKFDYYTSASNPGDPTPSPLLPNQQPSPYSYYTPSTRDFTAVYAR